MRMPALVCGTLYFSVCYVLYEASPERFVPPEIAGDSHSSVLWAWQRERSDESG